jgi:CheY-like chemotaxis protein
MPATAPLFDPADEPPVILIAEDEWLIRSVAADAMRGLGAEVVEARDASEALAYLSSGARVDLVFTDNRMPGGMIGTQLAQTIEARWPAVKVVMTSGQDIGGWRGRTVPKPYDFTRLATELIQLALENRRRGT